MKEIIITILFVIVLIGFIATVWEEFSWARKDKRKPFHDMHCNWQGGAKTFLAFAILILFASLFGLL